MPSLGPKPEWSWMSGPDAQGTELWKGDGTVNWHTSFSELSALAEDVEALDSDLARDF